ncbi:MAG: endo-1,4-beta-xylanase [Oscillospiraceae bacterium]|nr:endo-1,4-beta-xylanase [Oscillospiraceae bacterium]
MDKKKHLRAISAATAVLCALGLGAVYPDFGAQHAAAEAVHNDFEETYCGWHGSTQTVDVTALDGVGFAGSRGMVVSGRADAAEGAASSKGFYLVGGVAYTYHVQVMADTDETFRLTMRTIDQKTGEETVKEILSKDVQAGVWTELSAVYTAPKDSYEFELTVTTDTTNDFRFDEVTVTSEKPVNTVSAATAEKGLKDEFANYFRVGNILNGGTIQNSAITARLIKDCNSIECENETKPDATLVQSGSTNTNIKVSLNSCAAIMDFCVEHGIGMRGHTMVWHSQTPSWFFKDNFQNGGNWVSADVMDQRMESYIKNMFSAIQTQYPTLDLYAYDICNECISDDASRTTNGKDGAREAGDSQIQGQGGKSAWVQVYGNNSFIEKAFTYARKYAPEGCDLYYNDYNEYWDHKRDCIYNMCKSLYEKGLLDGVGMQSHVPANATGFAGTDSYTEAMKKYLSIGCDVQITELDISVLDNNVQYSYTDQANKYKAIFQAAMDWNTAPESAGRVTAVCIWGPDDGHSWLSSGSNALLYDASGEPKEAYTALTSMISQSEWGDGTVVPGREVKVIEPDENGWYFHSTFEGSEDGWSGRGAASVAVSPALTYKGSGALYTDGRTASWNGASMPISANPFKPGETFSFSVNVGYMEGADTTDFKFTLQYTGSDGEPHYDEIASATGNKGQWVQLANENYTIPEGASQMQIYVETYDESTGSFYIDEAIGAVAGTKIEGAGQPQVRKAVLGDVDCDGVIDAMDLALAKRGVLGKFADSIAMKAADVDQSGTPDVTDIVLLTKYIHGMISEFPVAEKPAPAIDTAKWDSYQETASPQMIEFYQNAIYQMGNTSRLWNAVAKAESGAPTTVAYLGGSITEGNHAPTCYAQRSFDYFAETFGTGNNCKFINAGLSGTSSAVGLMRAQRDILDAKPDVIFIEFSVNDHPEQLYKKSFESLVKRCLMQEQEPAVIILINRAKGGYSMQEQMAAVGKLYDVPVISMDNALTKAFNSGLLKTDDYYTDEYHPHADGAKLISDCIGYYYRQALKSANQSDAYTIPTGKVYGNEYATGTIVPLSDLKDLQTGSFKADNSNTRFAYGFTFQKNTGNSPMTFTTEGRGIFLVFRSNQNSSLGTALVTVNGKTAEISGNRQYAWGGPEAEFAYIQDASGKLDVSIKLDNGGADFNIYGIGVIK